MDYNRLILETSAYFIDFMDQHETSHLWFHNVTHTHEVVEAARRMGRFYKLDERDMTIVSIAAYFHDTGYCEKGPADHEARSAELAEQFLTGQKVDLEFINAVKNCILATKLPQSPQNLLEEIVCDADLFHFGNVWFSSRDKLMRKEMEEAGCLIDKNEWRKETIGLMEKHRYHTSYCRERLEARKRQNIEALQKKEVAPALSTVPAAPGEEKQKGKRPDRGIETMFRITSTNNQRLSDMADNKANILITVNSIILSVVIALLLRKLDNNVHLIVPTAILLCISLGTIVLAILATRPSIPDGYYSETDLKEKKVNLLFFGNFFKMDLMNYSNGMKQVMEDRDFLYNTLIKDVYSQGVVLGRKYKLLRRAYSLFMYGLIVSVMAFLIVVIINA